MNPVSKTEITQHAFGTVNSEDKTEIQPQWQGCPTKAIIIPVTQRAAASLMDPLLQFFFCVLIAMLKSQVWLSYLKDGDPVPAFLCLVQFHCRTPIEQQPWVCTSSKLNCLLGKRVSPVWKGTQSSTATATSQPSCKNCSKYDFIY